MRLFYVFLSLSNFCKNCIYYNSVPQDATLEKSTCLKFDSKFVDMCREDENKCGINAKHFKPKIVQLEISQFVSCKSCEHYNNSLNHCKIFKKTNIITGNIVYDYIELCRMDETRCGKEGKFYIPIPKKD